MSFKKHVECENTDIKMVMTRKRFPSPKIDPTPLAPYTHLEKSVVNRTIQNCNLIVHLLFK